MSVEPGSLIRIGSRVAGSGTATERTAASASNSSSGSSVSIGVASGVDSSGSGSASADGVADPTEAVPGSAALVHPANRTADATAHPVIRSNGLLTKKRKRSLLLEPEGEQDR